jgi:hypothetical protein
MNDLILYRMPDEREGGICVASLVLALNGVALLRMNEQFADTWPSPDMEVPEPLANLIMALEQALARNCVHRDMRPKPLSVAIEGGRTWLRAEVQD